MRIIDRKKVLKLKNINFSQIKSMINIIIQNKRAILELHARRGEESIGEKYQTDWIRR